MMDDGSAKCLLDVINDPTALQEFLRSNSQDNSLPSKNPPQDAISRSSYVNLNRLATPALNTSTTRGATVASALPSNMRVPSLGSGTSLTGINSSTAPQGTFVNAVVNNNGIARTSGNTNAPFNVGIVPSAVPVSTGVLKAPGLEATSNAVNKVGSTGLAISASPGIVAVPKPSVTSASTFQGKKPIPIQPKTPNVSSAVSNSTVGSPGNRGIQVINSGLPLVTHVTQKQCAGGQQNVSPGHRAALNGIDSKANVRTNVAAGSVHTGKSSPGNLQPILSTTPVKRIAPKQPSMLPQTSTMSSPPQVVGTQHKILLQQVSNQVTPQVQTVVNQVSRGNVQQQNHTTQLIQAQQLLNLIRGQNPAVQVTQQTSPQVVQSQALPANQIKQIQQLVQQKLSNQQQQPSVVQTVQQNVLSPAQLQATLKQKPQLTTQTVQPTQPQNIVVQEEVIKQLLQQVTHQKPAQNIVQSQQLFQQIQQQSQPVQKQIIVQNIQPQSVGQGQPTTQTLRVDVTAPAKHSNVKQRTDTVASPVSIQLQQVLNNQQKQVHQILGQQQVNLTPQQTVAKDQSARLLQGVTFVQNQPNKTSTAQVLNQGGIVQQVNSVVQQGKSTTSPIVQIVTTTQQNTVPQTQQAQNSGVQKVFIIKQPELLQKLGLQGTKTQQTIQITPQQLQALKQFQLQQQVVKQKLSGSNLQTASNVQAKSLTADQLKQLQLQQQLQGSGVKQVVLQTRTQQPVLQQQRQVNVKTQGKMQHIPRILQTSGRQPVSQSVKVSVPIKQETSKGVKRPHSSDTADVPKTASRLKQGLAQDQQAVLRPDIKSSFTSREDVIKRLTPYHVCYDPSPTLADVQKADNLYSSVSSQLVKRSQKMMEKYRQLLFDESMREHPSAEMVMLYRVFLTNERAALAEEKKLAKENPTELLNAIKKGNNFEETSNSIQPLDTPMEVSPSVKDTSSLVMSSTENDIVSSMKNTVSEASSKISSLLNIDMSQPSRNSLSPQTEICSSTSQLSTKPDLTTNPSSVNNHVSSFSSKGLYDKQTSGLKEQTEENHRLTTDSPVDVPMDTESEKEDVTATLALLNSMASELDEVLDVEGTL